MDGKHGSSLGGRFDLLLYGSVGSRFGDAGRVAAVGLLAASITSDPRLTALVTVATFLPWVLFGLWAGAVVDRVDARWAFLLSDSARAVLAVGLAVALFADRASLWMVLAVVFVMTTLQTVSDSCFVSLLPRVVASPDLPRANARLSAAQTGIGQFAGAPAGSALYAAGPALPFLVDGASFIAAATCVANVRTDPPEDRLARRMTPRILWQDIVEGLRWMYGVRQVGGVCATTAAMNFAAGGNQAVLALYALHVVGSTPAQFGLFTGVWAVFGVVGALLAGRLSQRVAPIGIATSAVALQSTGYILLAMAPNLWTALAGMGINGLTAGSWNVSYSSILQTQSPAVMLGRVGAAGRTISMCTVPAGAIVAGVVANLWGFRTPAVIAAVCDAVAAMWLVWWLRKPDRQYATDSAATTERVG
ncbi:MFS transporter [Kitasatospora sp. NPDC056783]|uniref:MFS transporter n=1 Tax=Kitasatospora sp. NPDC056783 TaxID=3345943 RepID=UPI0036AB14AD